MEMEFMFFHPIRDNTLTGFFGSKDEEDAFLGSLTDDAREYLRNHSDEISTKEELEVIAARFCDGCDEVTETDWKM